MSSGAIDYQYGDASNALLIASDLEADAVIAQYESELKTAGWTFAGDDGYGNNYFVSPNSEIKVCAWSYYGYARVDIVIIKPAATPDGATPESVLIEIFTALGASNPAGKVSEPQSGFFYGYMGLAYGDSEDFPGWLSTIEDYYLPRYLVAVTPAYDTTYGGDYALEKDFLTSNGEILVRVIMNCSNDIVWVDFIAYVYQQA